MFFLQAEWIFVIVPLVTYNLPMMLIFSLTPTSRHDMLAGVGYQ